MENNTTEKTNISDAETFAKAILEMADTRPPLYHQLYLHFNEEMQRAIRYGGVCTPERMARLYPIFREINDEQEEISREMAKENRRVKKRNRQ